LTLNSNHSFEYLYTLDSGEIKFVKSYRTNKNQFIAALNLKFFQINGRYPKKNDHIDPMITQYLAKLEYSLISGQMNLEK
jgi:hypothetical protein